MRRGRQRKLRSGGLLPWTRAPYGYRTDPDRPRDPAGVRLEPAAAAVVAELFARYSEQGMSLLRLAVDLSVRGTSTPTGKWRLPSGDPARHLEQPHLYGPGIRGAYPQSACACAPLGHPCARPSDRGPCMHVAGGVGGSGSRSFGITEVKEQQRPGGDRGEQLRPMTLLCGIGVAIKPYPPRQAGSQVEQGRHPSG